MSDILKMIEVLRSSNDLPDCVEYKAVLRIVEIGYVSKEIHYRCDTKEAKEAVERLKRQLVSQILDKVYREVIDKLDVMRRKLYVEARSAMFEGYTAKIEMAEKIGKLANELRGIV